MLPVVVGGLDDTVQRGQVSLITSCRLWSRLCRTGSSSLVWELAAAAQWGAEEKKCLPSQALPLAYPDLTLVSTGLHEVASKPSTLWVRGGMGEADVALKLYTLQIDPVLAPSSKVSDKIFLSHWLS